MYPMVVMIEWSEEFCDGKRPFMSQSTYSELGVQVLDEGEVFLVVLLSLLRFLLGDKKTYCTVDRKSREVLEKWLTVEEARCIFSVL